MKAAETPFPLPADLDALIDRALAEDIGPGDITIRAVDPGTVPGRAVILAKGAGVLSGVTVAQRVFERIDAGVTVALLQQDGDVLSAGMPVLRAAGPIAPLLTGERTALNFLGRLSGVATLTAQYVAAVAGTGTKILDTRKTTPGLRLLEKYAVTCGGGLNHRIGLYDMFLIKENHIAGAGGLTPAVERVLAWRAAHEPGVLVEVETETLEQVREAAGLGVDRILLDNMTPAEVADAVAVTDGRVPLEASGGITLATARVYAETGVDYLSVGALTHSAPAFDCSMQLEEPHS